MKPYPAYKDTGIPWIGEVPEKWEVTKVKFLSATPVQYGLNIGAENYIQDGIRFIRTTDIDDLGNLTEDGVYLPEELVAKEYMLQDGDFLISRSGTVGRAYVHSSSKHQFSYAGYLVRFTFDEPSIAKFLFYFTKSGAFSIWLESISIESTIVNVNGQKYANLSIALPVNETEQRTIAAYLDRKTAQIDTLIANKRRRVELLNEERTALISHAVTKGLDPDAPLKDSGVAWIGEIPVGWEIQAIKRHFDVELGKMLNRSTEDGSGIIKPYMRAANVHWHGIELEAGINEMEFSPSQLERYRLQVGDLLVTEGGVTVGRSAIWNDELDECYYQNSLNRVRPIQANTVSIRYLYYWMYLAKTSGYIDLLSGKATFGHLTNVMLKELITLVPSLPEQRAIAAYLDEKTASIDRAIAHAEQQIALLQEYRTALISAAVTGKIDVRDARLGQSQKTGPISEDVR